MSFIKYLKERWITYIFIIFAFMFSAVVYKLDKSFNISKSNANYIMAGWMILFVLFVVIDYGVFNSRIKKFKKYCRLNTSSEDLEEFMYPTDREYAELMHKLALQYEKYKADIYTKSSEELEFITKWVHDVKVPIAAIRLILENSDEDIPNNLYRDIDTELFSIEQSVQRIFYQIKSNTLHDDYKIQKISTKKLIAGALKGYSNFFSYNKINIQVTGETYDVLTDEKWSGYILSEILSNAVKYTPAKGFIAISTSKTGNQIAISIKNSGKGILQKDIGQIFNKGYTSSETAESKYGEYAMFNLTFIETKTIHHVTKM